MLLLVSLVIISMHLVNWFTPSDFAFAWKKRLVWNFEIQLWKHLY